MRTALLLDAGPCGQPRTCPTDHVTTACRVVDVGVGRGDLTDAEWERLRSFLVASNGRCGRWRHDRQVINGMLRRARTGVQGCDLPKRFGR
ncbi:hypothetical protein BKD26_26095 [Streptomyces sp. CB03238]|nr:hypothetical protein BKD26_26095 [Streptomyces sp. CB03238]